MIKAIRLMASDDLNYNDVSIYEKGDKNFDNIPDYFEGSSLIISTIDHNKILIPVHSVKYIHYKKSPNKFNNDIGKKISRITINGGISHKNPYILNPGKFKEANVPLIFNKYEQFVFCVNEGIFITTDYNISAMYI